MSGFPSILGVHSGGVKSNAANNGSVAKRLQNELMNLMMGGDKGISAFPDNENLFSWIGTLHGASGTAYDGLKYKVSLVFPSEYPFKPPEVKFVSPCFHPNVDDHGNICLDILKEKWTALYDVRTILLSLQSLLGEPNIDSPLNVRAAEMWKNQSAYRTSLLEHYAKYVDTDTLLPRTTTAAASQARTSPTTDMN